MADDGGGVAVEMAEVRPSIAPLMESSTSPSTEHLEGINFQGPITIEFENVSYSVDEVMSSVTMLDRIKGRKPEVKEKYLLQGISGQFKPGQLTALIGPSGAGKTILLDLISNRRTMGHIYGDIRFNGHPFSKSLRTQIGFVEQRDVLLPWLTVRETFMYTARLKFPKEVSQEELEKKVNDLLEQLALTICADNIIRAPPALGISGGQAKRTNIGIELITNPKILLLDEPTTGLDSATSVECVKVLRHLAEGGRTIVATIRQPSKNAFAMFDRLLMLVEGHTAYYGDLKDAVPYFGTLGYVCPPRMNPAEFLVNLTDPRAPPVNGQKQAPPGFFAAEYAKSHLHEARLRSIADTQLRRQSTRRLLEERAKTDNLSRRDLTEDDDKEHFANSAVRNTFILAERLAKQKRRNKLYGIARVGRVLMMGFILATLFHSQSHDEDGVTAIVSSILFSVMMLAFGSMSFMGVFIEQRAFFTRERNAGTYQVVSYMVAQILSDIPYNLLQVAVWSIIIYFSVGLRSGADHYFTYALFIYVILETSIGMAQCFASVAKDFEGASVMSFPFVLLAFLFSGFYLRRPLIPDYWIWAFYSSYLQYGLSGIVINQFDDDYSYTKKTPCYACVPAPSNSALACLDEVSSLRNGTWYCCTPSSLPSVEVWDPNKLLSVWGYGPESAISSLWPNLAVLGGFWAFWWTLTYLGLRYKKHGTR